MGQATTFHVLGACAVGGIATLAAAVIAHIARHEPTPTPGPTHDSTDNPAERTTK